MTRGRLSHSSENLCTHQHHLLACTLQLLAAYQYMPCWILERFDFVTQSFDTALTVAVLSPLVHISLSIPAIWSQSDAEMQSGSTGKEFLFLWTIQSTLCGCWNCTWYPIRHHTLCSRNFSLTLRWAALGPIVSNRRVIFSSCSGGTSLTLWDILAVWNLVWMAGRSAKKTCKK